MSRIKHVFEQLKSENKTALIPYITAGDPHPDITVALMHKMVAAGADIIELGVPFSDPMADGPVIQQACERALVHNVSLNNVLDMVAEFRQQDEKTPLILMGYCNPIEIMGYKKFADKAQQVGLDGVLTVDLPPEEAYEANNLFEQVGLDSIFLLSPTSTSERIQTICENASGFVYYVSLKGVTGAANLDVTEVSHKIEQIRQHTDLPIGVGFGIKNPETAQQVATVADAVVVGSAIINKIVEYKDSAEKINAEVYTLLHDIRRALDA